MSCMRRLARPLLLAGIAAAVVGLSKAHAAAHGYDYTASFRFAWSVAYIVLLCVAAYGAGLPELPRTRRAVALTAAGATGAAALAMSVHLAGSEGYVYEALERFLPLPSAEVVAREVDTPADLVRARNALQEWPRA